MKISRSLFCFLLTIVCAITAQAQAIKILYQNDSLSFRGLSVVSDRVVWVSGSRGTVGRSVDGGEHWTWMIVPGFEKRDFRDIEAFDEKTALIMAISEPANILKTTDGGKSWKTVYTNTDPGMFLDAMDFKGKQGVVIGDPLDGKFFLARSSDAGNSWQEFDASERPSADSGEACFASSGTNISLGDDGTFQFVSGGLRAAFFKGGKSFILPLVQGLQSTGANSLAAFKSKNANILAVVGGDFAKDKQVEKNCFISHDGGLFWRPPVQPPAGYRSCIIFLTDLILLTCGTSGIDISKDGGSHWEMVSPDSFHVCKKASSGKVVFLAGSKGKIAVLNSAIY